MVSLSGLSELGYNSPLSAPLDTFQLEAATTFGSEGISAPVDGKQREKVKERYISDCGIMVQ